MIKEQMNRLEKVKGTNFLFKDPLTRVVHNLNHAEAENARMLKRERKIKMEEQDRLKHDVDVLKNDMSEIKTLLKQMVEKHG